MEGTAPAASCRKCGAHELTFQRFEPVYWLTEYQPHEVLERLASNPDLFAKAIEELPPDRLSFAPEGTAWAAVDVLRHVRDAESVLAQRIPLILEETEPRLEFQPVFAWTNERTGLAESAESVLKTYATSRNASVSRLREIGPEDWRRAGLHEEFGRVTLIEQASYFAAHELTHLRQLEQLRRVLVGD
jgi:hypothetical protein